MDREKKLIRKALAISTIASMGISLATVSPSLASADQINVSQKEVRTDTAILDWKEPIFNATEIYGKNIGGKGYYKYTDSFGYRQGNGTYYGATFQQLSVEADGSPIITNSKNIFVGKTTLTNNTDQEQTLSTNSFSKMISNSIAHSTTHGFKFGTKASAKFNIPLVGETGIELSAEYNFSDTSSQTNTESYTYTASPQNIKVPAHSSVEVIVTSTDEWAGKDAENFIYADEPNGKYGTSYWYDKPFYEIVKYASYFEKLQNIAPNSDGQTINLIGSGKYEAEYGTEFTVDVNPVDKDNVAKRSSNEGYTYKVKPEIKKEN